jgi:hypothetical protein
MAGEKPVIAADPERDSVHSQRLSSPAQSG